jgi:hypothetical protein
MPSVYDQNAFTSVWFYGWIPNEAQGQCYFNLLFYTLLYLIFYTSFVLANICTVWFHFICSITGIYQCILFDPTGKNITYFPGFFITNRELLIFLLFLLLSLTISMMLLTFSIHCCQIILLMKCNTKMYRNISVQIHWNGNKEIHYNTQQFSPHTVQVAAVM